MESANKSMWMGDRPQSESLQDKIASILNKCSRENESNTPDFILAEYLTSCLAAFEQATRLRDNWYGGKQSILDSEKQEKW